MFMKSWNFRIPSLTVIFIAAVVVSPLVFVVVADERVAIERQESIRREIEATNAVVVQHNTLSALHTMRSVLTECAPPFAIKDARERLILALAEFKTESNQLASTGILDPAATSIGTSIQRALLSPIGHPDAFNAAVPKLLHAIEFTANHGGLQYEGPLSDALNYRVAFALNAYEDARLAFQGRCLARSAFGIAKTKAAAAAGRGATAISFIDSDLKAAGVAHPADAATLAVLGDVETAANAFSLAIDELGSLSTIDLQSLARMQTQSDLLRAALENTTYTVADLLSGELNTRRSAEERRSRFDSLALIATLLLIPFIALAIARVIEQQAQRRAKLVEMERGHAATAAQFEAIFDETSAGIAIYNRLGDLFRKNAELTRVLGADSAEIIRSLCPSFESIFQDGPVDIAPPSLVGPNGSTLWIEVGYSIIRSGKRAEDKAYVLAIVRNVSEQRQTTERLAYEASHDSLTKLPNRPRFLELLHDRLELLSAGSRLYVAFVDLDHFKYVNDSFGHALGDIVLVQSAERLAKCADGVHTVARFGGDEFVLMFVDDTGTLDIEAVVDNLLDAFRRPFETPAGSIRLECSVGITMGGSKHRGLEHELIREADTAMYHAKSAGRGRYSVFSGEMRDAAIHRLRYGTDLPLAVERNEFFVEYQPIIDIDTGLLASIEALLRWQHTTEGVISPEEFIPVAEETGAIILIGRWVLRTACLQQMLWRESGNALADVVINVNVSVREVLDERYAGEVVAILSETGADASMIALEMTESVLLDPTSIALGNLLFLKTLGFRIVIDDFGTGYSSLRYLQEFPFDGLKIDRSFTQDVVRMKTIVKMIVDLGSALNVTIVAEGIETEEQQERIRELGCLLGQGFLYSRSVSSTIIQENYQQLTLASSAARCLPK